VRALAQELQPRVRRLARVVVVAVAGQRDGLFAAGRPGLRGSHDGAPLSPWSLLFGVPAWPAANPPSAHAEPTPPRAPSPRSVRARVADRAVPACRSDTCA